MGDDEEDDGKLKPRKMGVDDDFMQHPDSGAFIRNPLKAARCKSTPILLSANEFNHNMLDDTLGEWHCVSVTESGFRDMMSSYAETHGSSLPSTWSRRATQLQLTRCSVGRVHSLSTGFDFVVQIRKSSYVAPRKKPPRPGDRKGADGVTIDKLNIEVSADGDGSILRVENILEGLILGWNRSHLQFAVRIGDHITRVNNRKRSAASMIEEMQTCPDLLRITFHRSPQSALDTIDPQNGTLLPAIVQPRG
jgi:hypothetical protein